MATEVGSGGGRVKCRAAFRVVDRGGWRLGLIRPLPCFSHQPRPLDSPLIPPRDHRVRGPDLEKPVAVVTPEQFLERLAAVRIDRSHGGRAPHKPLMLLLALSRVRLRRRHTRRRSQALRDHGRLPTGRPRSSLPPPRTRLGDCLLGLEAAHIRWHSHEGGDVVPNGLALCSVHHKASDYGALGLDWKPGGFQVLISSKVQGGSPSARRLLGFRGKAIRPPVSPSDAPDPRFVDWHRREVFHP